MQERGKKPNKNKSDLLAKGTCSFHLRRKLVEGEREKIISCKANFLCLKNHRHLCSVNNIIKQENKTRDCRGCITRN